MEATLEAGRNTVRVVRGGGSLRPGDNAQGSLRAIVFEPAGGRTDVRTAPASDGGAVWRRTVDGVALVRSPAEAPGTAAVSRSRSASLSPVSTWHAARSH